jgi:3-oxoacyl-[acyl-carrier protein] reductase
VTRRSGEAQRDVGEPIRSEQEGHVAKTGRRPKDHSAAPAVVSGGARGIGAAIVRRLAEDGHRVGIGYSSSAQPAEALADELAQEGKQAAAFHLDVRSDESVEAFGKAVEAQFGPPLVLVNNAGYRRDQLLLESTPEAWRETFEVNVFGAYRMTMRFLHEMITARWGRIVNISSGSSKIGTPAQTAYCASKAGLDGFTRALAAEVGRRNIVVNSVAPGFVPTGMTRDVGPLQRDAILGRTPLKREGTVDEVASLVAYLVSEHGGYVHGQTLSVDGGLTG